MLALLADASLEELSEPDVIIVPGGHITPELTNDEQLLAWLRHAHEHSQWTTSVCTGALLLAAAGILNGLQATTHWLALDKLASYGAHPVRERVVEQGKIITLCGRIRRDRHGAHPRGPNRRRPNRTSDPAQHRVRSAATLQRGLYPLSSRPHRAASPFHRRKSRIRTAVIIVCCSRLRRSCYHSR